MRVVGGCAEKDALDSPRRKLLYAGFILFTHRLLLKGRRQCHNLHGEIPWSTEVVEVDGLVARSRSRVRSTTSLW